MSIPHVAFCDGGLCNRLNALIFALILRGRFGGAWRLAWPVNNWCGASFERLFSADGLTVDAVPLADFKAQEQAYTRIVHENQCAFVPEGLYFQSALHTYDDYAGLFALGKPVFYYHNLIPPCADLGDIQLALQSVQIQPAIAERARAFCREQGIDGSVLGLHIRKTDFGNAVDDQGLFKLVSESPNRFFVCSDDAEVNARFAALPNCAVFPKQSFPEKLVGEGGWNAQTIDNQGRVFGFNITRSEAALVDALIDLLILSRTTHVNTSHSTFLRMAMIFKATGYFAA